MKKKNERPTQCERIMDWLSEHGSITQLEAINKLGVLRLASRISEIKKKYGTQFKVEMVVVKNRYGENCRIARYKII